MQKLFITSPISIAGCLITRGFAEGFKKLGFYVVEKDVRETTFEDIEKFNPDYILGYCYGYLVNQELAKDLLNNKKYKFIHYFGDEPQSRFAYTDRSELYDILKKAKKDVFIWDKEFVSDFKGCHYLPLAVDPKLYKTTFEGYEHDLSFVGRPLTEKRQKLLSLLIKKYGKLSLYCYEDHFKRSIDEMVNNNLLNSEEIELYKKSYKGFIRTEEELAKVYNSTKVNINITEQGKDNINYRVFEVLASSGFLLTDYMPDIYNHFEVGKELDIYQNDCELIDKIDFYLQNLNIAQSIARNGRRCVVNNHTFKQRAEKILKLMNVKGKMM